VRRHPAERGPTLVRRNRNRDRDGRHGATRGQEFCLYRELGHLRRPERCGVLGPVAPASERGLQCRRRRRLPAGRRRRTARPHLDVVRLTACRRVELWRSLRASPARRVNLRTTTSAWRGVFHRAGPGGSNGLDLREMTIMGPQLILRSLIFVALAAASSSSVWAAEAKAPLRAHAPTPALIDRNGVLILIRSTLLALDHANKTGNYTVLRDLGSPGFQTNTAARLAEIFATQRKDNIDLSGALVLEPQLTVLPQIEANGLMHMAGFFPSVPT